MDFDLSFNPDDWRYKTAKIKKKDLIKIRLKLVDDIRNSFNEVVNNA